MKFPFLVSYLLGLLNFRHRSFMSDHEQPARSTTSGYPPLNRRFKRLIRRLDYFLFKTPFTQKPHPKRNLKLIHPRVNRSYNTIHSSYIQIIAKEYRFIREKRFFRNSNFSKCLSAIFGTSCVNIGFVSFGVSSVLIN
jgi:hypothetical protein